MSGAYLGHNLGHVWPSSGACLGIIWSLSGAVCQQWTTIPGATCICEDVFLCNMPGANSSWIFWSYCKICLTSFVLCKSYSFWSAGGFGACTGIIAKVPVGFWLNLFPIIALQSRFFSVNKREEEVLFPEKRRLTSRVSEWVGKPHQLHSWHGEVGDHTAA